MAISFDNFIFAERLERLFPVPQDRQGRAASINVSAPLSQSLPVIVTTPEGRSSSFQAETSLIPACHADRGNKIRSMSR